MKGSKFAPHVLKEMPSSVEPNNSFGICLDNDINTSTCRLTEENNNTIIKFMIHVHTVCRENFCIEMCISNREKISPLSQYL